MYGNNSSNFPAHWDVLREIAKKIPAVFFANRNLENLQVLPTKLFPQFQKNLKAVEKFYCRFDLLQKLPR